MTALPAIGHNNPPDPLDDVLAPYGHDISEAENWLDGKAVETEAQMRAVDRLAAAIREARRDVERARESACAPLHDAWKAEMARWKPTQDDLARIQKGLAAVVDGFKRRLDEEQEAKRRAVEAEAEAARQRAEALLAEARAGDIESQREAAQAMAAVRAAERDAAAVRKGAVKGLRTVTRWEVTDLSALLRWINANDRPALGAFAEDYARKHHGDGTDRPGLRVWKEKIAI